MKYILENCKVYNNFTLKREKENDSFDVVV